MSDICRPDLGLHSATPDLSQTTHWVTIIPTTCKAKVDTGHAWLTYPLSTLCQGAPPLWYLLLKILVNLFSGRAMYDTLMYWYTTRSTVNKGTLTIVNICSLALSLCYWYNLQSQQHTWHVRVRVHRRHTPCCRTYQYPYAPTSCPQKYLIAQRRKKWSINPNNSVSIYLW